MSHTSTSCKQEDNQSEEMNRNKTLTLLQKGKDLSCWMEVRQGNVRGNLRRKDLGSRYSTGNLVCLRR